MVQEKERIATTATEQQKPINIMRPLPPMRPAEGGGSGNNIGGGNDGGGGGSGGGSFNWGKIFGYGAGAIVLSCAVRSCHWRDDGGRFFEEIVNPWAAVKSISITLFWIGLFVFFVCHVARGIALLPLRGKWSTISNFAKSRFSIVPTYLLSAIIILANYLPKQLVTEYFGKRLFCAFLSGLAMALFQIIFYLSSPKDNNDDSARPIPRYILVLLASFSIVISTLLTATLVANVFSYAPSNWWEALFPWLKNGGKILEV